MWRWLRIRENQIVVLFVNSFQIPQISIHLLQNLHYWCKCNTHDVVISVSKYFQNLHSPIVCGKGGRDVKSMRRITMPWEKDNFAEWNAYSTKKLPPFPPTCCRFGLSEINDLNYYNCCQTTNIRTHVQVCVDHAQSRLQLPCVAVQDADQLPLQSEHLSLSILIKESVYTFENSNQSWIV